MNAEVEANPQVQIAWHTVPFQHRDSYPLEVMGRILSGRTGRLHKALVLEAKIATSASADQQSSKWGGAFAASAEVREGHTPQECEQAIYEQIKRLASEEVPAEELQKIKNQFAASEYRRLSGNFPILMQLVQNDGLGNWREINEAGAKFQAVTAADIRRVAGQYCTPENRAVATFTRKPGGAPRTAPVVRPTR